MATTNFPFGSTSFGAPAGGSGMPALFSAESVINGADFPRRYLFVDPTNGANGNDGFSTSTAKQTVTAALAMRLPGDCIVLVDVAAENVTINRYYTGLSNASGGPLWIVGLSTRGAVAITPATGVAIVNHEDDVTIVNVGLACPDAATSSLQNDGTRLRVFGSKIEGSATSGAGVLLAPGTIAQRDAHIRGNCGDILFDDCEFAWGYDGIRLSGTDYGATTQVFVQNCRFHNLTHASFAEAVGSGGSAAVTFRNLMVKDCIFDAAEDGTVPTAWFLLNASNSNTGIVTRCSLPTAINSGKNLVSTLLKWTSNFHTGGVSTAQPS